jgi:aldose 1-epimerase
VIELAAGNLEAVFLPAQGMVCRSLKHRGDELLRRVDNLLAYAAAGSQAGIPLLHPWANRLDGLRYRVGGREVQLDPSSPLLHFDANRLPLHGVPWPRLAWEAVATEARIDARLDWSRSDLLAVFPFPHRLELAVILGSDALTFETTLVAGAAGVVPVSFGFHPHFGLPGVPRAQWRLELPALRHLALDPRGIPTGAEEESLPSDAELGARTFDDGFALRRSAESFHLSGGGRRIAVELLEGYSHVQLYAPQAEELVSIEPMTAPTNALVHGRSLPLVAPGGRYRAVFRVRVEPP